MVQENIFPDFTRSIPRDIKEKRLGQKGKVLWFTGLSGAGKSTLAFAVEKALFNRGHFVMVLDGDNIRSGINNNLGFNPEDRKENIRRIAEIARLFSRAGIITIAACISPTNEIREMAREIIGKDDYFEVFVSTPLEVCESRDVKGLYRKARDGKINDFTGISAPFDIPFDPDGAVNTIGKSVEECTQVILDKGLDDLKL